MSAVRTRNALPEALQPPPKQKGAMDVVTLAKALSGQLAAFTAQVQAEATDTRVPVSEPLFKQLASMTKAGVTIRSIVELALIEYFDLLATTPNRDADGSAKLAGRKLAEHLFWKDRNCNLCRSEMSWGGRPEALPKLLNMADGEAKLVCGDCHDWITGCTSGEARE